MEKMVITCPCGQRLQAPESAVGKQGVCPRCKKTFRIGGVAGLPGLPAAARPANGHNGASRAFTQAPARFSHAVDLYNQRRYAEALVVLEALLRELPGNAEIEDARRCCIEMMREAASTARAEIKAIKHAELDEKTAKRVLLDLMLHSESDAVRLDAVKTTLALLRPPAVPDAHPRLDEEELGLFRF